MLSGKILPYGQVFAKIKQPPTFGKWTCFGCEKNADPERTMRLKTSKKRHFLRKECRTTDRPLVVGRSVTFVFLYALPKKHALRACNYVSCLTSDFSRRANR